MNSLDLLSATDGTKFGQVVPVVEHSTLASVWIEGLQVGGVIVLRTASELVLYQLTKNEAATGAVAITGQSGYFWAPASLGLVISLLTASTPGVKFEDDASYTYLRVTDGNANTLFLPSRDGGVLLSALTLAADGKIPGPYTNDAAAATASVAVGDPYFDDDSFVKIRQV